MCDCQKYTKVTHCIFDLDGTLLDTETRYMNIIADVLKEYGKEYTVEARSKMFGRTMKDTWKTAIEIFNLEESLETIIEKFENKCTTAILDCPLLPGVEKLVRHLHKNNIPIAIATSSDESQYVNKTQHLQEFFSLFHHAVTAGTDPEVKMGKPSPDIFFVCASRFPDNPDPKQCLIFEDSPSGVNAANSAGMQCVWIPDPVIPRELGRSATLVLKSMSAFKPEKFELPPF